MPTTIEALVIIALVLAPGFIFAQSARGVIAFAKDASDLRLLLPTIACGTVVHIIMSPWTVRVIRYYTGDALNDHVVEAIAWGGVTCIVSPVLLGVAVGRLSNVKLIDRLLDRIGLGYVDRMPSAWDYMFRLERSGFMRIYLRDGGVVGGAFYSDSFASTTPDRADIYLEQAWQLDESGTFIRPLVDNEGVWIAHDTIARIEFFSEGGDQSGS